MHSRTGGPLNTTVVGWRISDPVLLRSGGARHKSMQSGIVVWVNYKCSLICLIFWKLVPGPLLLFVIFTGAAQISDQFWSTVWSFDNKFKILILIFLSYSSGQSWRGILGRIIWYSYLELEELELELELLLRGFCSVWSMKGSACLENGFKL